MPARAEEQQVSQVYCLLPESLQNLSTPLPSPHQGPIGQNPQCSLYVRMCAVCVCAYMCTGVYACTRKPEINGGHLSQLLTTLFLL